MTEEYRLLSVEEALAMVLAQVSPLGGEQVSLLEALGRTLAEDIVAAYDIPPLSNAAMDGYALRAADSARATREQPLRLRVVGDLAAGYTTDRVVGVGEAIRIMTGAPVPAGADTVVPFEETTFAATWVELTRPLAAGQNIRRAGEDVQRGATILARGALLRAAEIGMLAALGRAQVLVTRRPRVGILATGDEVIEIDAPLTPGKIRNANSYSNAAQVLAAGGEPVLLGIAHDRIEEISAAVRRGLALGVDLLITSGGISVGDFDLVKRVLAAEGEIGFWQVRMRPGKPLAFGRIGGIPFLGLPGNPVAAMLSGELFVRPALARMLGQRATPRPTLWATLEESVKGKVGFRYYLRVTLQEREGRTYARLTGAQGSGILLSMVQAQGLAILPEDRGGAAAGDLVQVVLL